MTAVLTKIIKFLVFVFLIIPYMLIGFVIVFMSLLSADIYGLIFGCFFLLIPLPLLRGTIKKKTIPEKTIEPIQTITLPMVLCSRCGGAMDTSCKYCGDCGAPLNQEEV